MQLYLEGESKWANESVLTVGRLIQSKVVFHSESILRLICDLKDQKFDVLLVVLLDANRVATPHVCQPIADYAMFWAIGLPLTFCIDCSTVATVPTVTKNNANQ